MRFETECPAKINTFLAVGPPDLRGYHPIRTVFQSISLTDSLVVEESSDDELEVIGGEIPEDNTLTKALRFVRELAVVPPLAITLTKRIPMQSGLGGGSSDAAGLLRILQRIMPAPLPAPQLTDIALAVGADVPYFLVGGRARGEGYGEVLHALPDLPQRWVVVAKPNTNCSTKEMFASLDAACREFLSLEEDRIYNDFERVAPCESLDLIELLASAGARGAGLTGSGSAVFGFFDEPDTARRAADKLSTEFVAVRTTLPRVECLQVNETA